MERIPFSEEHRIFVDTFEARAATIVAGTTEIMKLIVAKELGL